MTRYKVVAWTGEHKTIWYVLDTKAPESLQPAVVCCGDNFNQAKVKAALLNLGIDPEPFE